MTKTIEIDSISDLKEFICLTNQMKVSVIVKKAPYSIDGKSLLGVMSLNPSTGLVVDFNNDDSDASKNLIDFINRHS